VGVGALQGGAAIRARMNRFRESGYTDDDAEPIVCSALSLLPDELSYPERALALLTLAVNDATKGQAVFMSTGVPLFVGLPAPERPGGSLEEVVGQALARLGEESGLRLDAARSRGFPTGRTGGLRALAEARALLERDVHLPGCLVAGVDSLVNAPALAWLARQGRLKRTGNSDGVIPGEAAACVFVTRKRQAEPLPLEVTGLGFAQEQATLDSDEPLRGLGLAKACRLALGEAGLELSEVDFRLADASGEGYAAKEVALASARLLRVRKESLPLWLPAESIGETGAAASVVALVLAAVGMRRGYAPGQRALICASSDEGDRAAAVVSMRELPKRGHP
jgi:3-oxoacyl-[acyl-carrier-protein] synthase-1